MNTTNHEISPKKESSTVELKITWSPFENSEGSALRPAVSPFTYGFSNPSRPQIRHDPVYSPFASPFSENMINRKTPHESRPRNEIGSLISPFGSEFRRGFVGEKISQSPDRKKIQSSQFGDSLPDPSFNTTLYVPTPINQQDIECLRREITSKTESTEKTSFTPSQKKHQQPSSFKNKPKELRMKRAMPETHVPKKKEKPFPCKYCKMGFSKAQALGGHMSRRHPGKSCEYNYKKTIRKMREIERIKLHLAKKKYFCSLNYDYDDLLKTVEGKMRARSLMNRTKIKRIKRDLTEEEVNNFVDSRDMNDFAE